MTHSIQSPMFDRRRARIAARRRSTPTIKIDFADLLRPAATPRRPWSEAICESSLVAAMNCVLAGLTIVLMMGQLQP